RIPSGRRMPKNGARLTGTGARRVPSRLQFVPRGLGFRHMKILAPSPAELTRGRAATPIAFIRAIVLGYRLRGMDPASALAQAQIPPALLDDSSARVTAAQMELLSGVAMQELDDEALGWFSRRLPWGRSEERRVGEACSG